MNTHFRHQMRWSLRGRIVPVAIRSPRRNTGAGYFRINRPLCSCPLCSIYYARNGGIFEALADTRGRVSLQIRIGKFTVVGADIICP